MPPYKLQVAASQAEKRTRSRHFFIFFNMSEKEKEQKNIDDHKSKNNSRASNWLDKISSSWKTVTDGVARQEGANKDKDDTMRKYYDEAIEPYKPSK